jgi:hypothetical protein
MLDNLMCLVMFGIILARACGDTELKGFE